MRLFNLILLHVTIFLFSMVIYLITINWFVGMLVYVILYLSAALSIYLNKILKSIYQPYFNLFNSTSMLLFGVLFFAALFTLGLNTRSDFLFNTLQKNIPTVFLSIIAFTYALMVPIKLIRYKVYYKNEILYLIFDLSAFILTIGSLSWMIFSSPIFEIAKYYGLYYYYGLYLSLPFIVILIISKLLKLYIEKKAFTSS